MAPAASPVEKTTGLVIALPPHPWAVSVGLSALAANISELAGGGIPLPHLFEKEIRDLAEIIPSGQGTNTHPEGIAARAPDKIHLCLNI